VRQTRSMDRYGLTRQVVADAITFAHETFDALDLTLIGRGQGRMSEMIELANLSAMLGNVFRSGIEQASNHAFVSNGPHKYPDLLGKAEGCSDIEIKVALETNNPKGHLVKPGPHITVRYVLGRDDGGFTLGRENRGNVVWVWDVRVGELLDAHFNVSNTAGDSGKTAVINAAGMLALEPVYFDRHRCAYKATSKHTKALVAKFPLR